MFVCRNKKITEENFLAGSGYLPHALVSSGQGFGYLGIALIYLAYFGGLTAAAIYGAKPVFDMVAGVVLTGLNLSGLIFLGGKKTDVSVVRVAAEAEVAVLVGREKDFLELSRAPHLYSETVETPLPCMRLCPMESGKSIAEAFPMIKIGGFPENGAMLIDAINSVTGEHREQIKSLIEQKQSMENLRKENDGLSEELLKAKTAVTTAQEALTVIRSKHRERSLDFSRLTKAQRDEKCKELMQQLRQLKEMEEKPVTQTTLPLS